MSYAKWLELRQQEKQSVENGAVQTMAAVAEEEAAEEPAVKADPTALPVVEYFRAGQRFCIGEIDIEPFTIPHDAADPCGFVFHARSESLRMAIATDLGYIPPNVKQALREVDVLLLESNHDLEMLKDGPYPWSVKQRVLSRVGHLSNTAAAEFLERDYDGGAHTIVLGHLSEQNNLPELARLAAEQAIAGRMSLLGNRVLLAMQEKPLEPICL
jgi:phosphoribosyl 1,2-cyclic phosphodiesterase